MSTVEFRNQTELDGERLLNLFLDAAKGWSLGRVSVLVRYSRSSDFSGTCFYRDRRIHINLGRHVVFPYSLATHVARAKTIGRRWYKPAYYLHLADAYQLAVFIYLHEVYHMLVKRAKRNTRQKESMCDRFAARYMADRFGCRIAERSGRAVERSAWDFQDVERFVSAAREVRVTRAARRPVTTAPVSGATGLQLLLFGE